MRGLIAWALAVALLMSGAVCALGAAPDKEEKAPPAVKEDKAARGAEAKGDAEKPIHVYATDKGGAYHKAECRSLAAPKKEMTLEEANKAGLKPCPDCRPPVEVYATASGKKYHVVTCRHLAKSRKSLLLDDAVEKGYEPCGTCKPPALQKEPSKTEAKAAAK